MNSSEKVKCHAIIHSFAIASGAGNAAPAPGVGIAVDLGCMASMCMSLAAVFAKDSKGAVEEGLLLAGLKQLVTKQVFKELAKKKTTKELAKILAKQILKRVSVKCAAKETTKAIPIIGVIIASCMSVAMIEAEGWKLAYNMDSARKELAA